jgi:hypothetical protein
MDMRSLTSRIGNSSSSCLLWNLRRWLLLRQVLTSWTMTVSIWPHPSVMRRSAVRSTFESWLRERLCKSGSSKMSVSFLYFSIVLCVSMIAVPTGYKIVISRALGMHGIYCTQPSGRFAPSCFGAINPIHPSCPWYTCNYYIFDIFVYIFLLQFFYPALCLVIFSISCTSSFE